MTIDITNDLREEIKKLKGNSSDESFSDYLGVSRVTWAEYKNGGPLTTKLALALHRKITIISNLLDQQLLAE